MHIYFVGYHYDIYAILKIAIPNRKSLTIINAWKSLHGQFDTSGDTPDTYIQANDISREMKDCFEKEGVEFHLVPPNNHMDNAVDRAIQTFKRHFIADLSGLDLNFPIKHWDSLLI